ncbi:MAG: type I methionyl aminopeptidase [Saprospiraceae bacterium]|nr:type I methionyl aminopeptidase [Bacteroidia bacterium]NNE16059.1 type I methionyl aminopeptidase [Saprospiraceae bacterium]NNL91256.1 type I methionyl aminopeptidase [Saprospiraceae bacterium]
MIHYKTDEQIELIRESCMLVSKTLAHVATILKPGTTGLKIDKEAETFIRDHNAVPGFKGYNGFPGTLCISPNSGVVHGIPTDREFKDDDIISIDCGSYLNEYFGDSAFTFAMPNVSEEVMALLVATNESLYKGIEAAKVGARIGDIGHAIQSYTEARNYTVVRELVGHGIGKNLHEKPEVPNYGRRGNGPKIKKGLVIAIEPMINLGVKNVKQSDDGWTIETKDGKASAHYEHTVAIKEDKTDILSDHSIVVDAIKNNSEIKNISLKK